MEADGSLTFDSYCAQVYLAVSEQTRRKITSSFLWGEYTNCATVQQAAAKADFL